VSKRIHAPYRSGRYSAWIKVGRLRRQRYWLAKLAKFCPAAALLPPRSSHVKMACWAKQGWGGVDEFRRTIQAHTPPGH
jgi:hypothetical protein